MKFTVLSRIATIVSVAAVCASWVEASPVPSLRELRDDRGATILLIADRDYAAEYKAEREGGSPVTGRDDGEKETIARCRSVVEAKGKGKGVDESRVREFADCMASAVKEWGLGED